MQSDRPSRGIHASKSGFVLLVFSLVTFVVLVVSLLSSKMYVAWCFRGFVGFGTGAVVVGIGRTLRDSMVGFASFDVLNYWRFLVLPGFFSNQSTVFALVVPIWMIFVPCALVSLLFYRRARRKRLIGCCSTCEYNLTGNTSGTCPECGAPTPTKG